MRFGVATAGFHLEAGYESQLDGATAMGCDTFRLSVEWARCEPERGRTDDAAFDRYSRILDACHDRDLLPVVSLHHFTHPAWLGPDFWLSPAAAERFAAWVDTATERLAGRCRHWITVNELNVYALQTYLTGRFPPGRHLSIRRVVRTLDHMLAAHVLAFDTIKLRQPQAMVSTNNYALSIYELDRLLIDVLLGRGEAIGRHDLGPWLAGRRATYHASVGTPSPVERFLRRRARSALPLDKALPRAVAAVYASPHERALDFVGVDLYLPLVSKHMRLRNRALERPDAALLTRYLRLNHARGLPVWVTVSGPCTGEGRDAIDRAIEKGVPVEAFFIEANPQPSL